MRHQQAQDHTMKHQRRGETTPAAPGLGKLQVEGHGRARRHLKGEDGKVGKVGNEGKVSVFSLS
jgi:hypothetical protein